jgi:hypothetical protein
MNLFRIFSPPPRPAQPQAQIPQPPVIISFYRTKDGLADYQFSFERQPNGQWRAYILTNPNYGSRPDDGHTTHRFTDGGRHFICWNKPLWSEAEARLVAALWSDLTQRYVQFGERF